MLPSKVLILGFIYALVSPLKFLFWKSCNKIYFHFLLSLLNKTIKKFELIAGLKEQIFSIYTNEFVK